MAEVKKCIQSLAVCYLLLGAAILPNTGIIPIRFPTDRFLAVYHLLLSVCLILRYYLLVAGRKRVKHAMLHIAVRIGQQYRCVITDATGSQLISDAVTINQA